MAHAVAPTGRVQRTICEVLAVFCLISVTPVSLAQSPKSSAMKDPGANAKAGSVLNDSWNRCIATAEGNRSARDFDFFRAAKHLSNSKPWFVEHSLKNEARFCAEVLACEVKFKRVYAIYSSAYSACS